MASSSASTGLAAVFAPIPAMWSTTPVGKPGGLVQWRGRFLSARAAAGAGEGSRGTDQGDEGDDKGHPAPMGGDGQQAVRPCEDGERSEQGDHAVMFQRVRRRAAWRALPWSTICAAWWRRRLLKCSSGLFAVGDEGFHEEEQAAEKQTHLPCELAAGRVFPAHRAAAAVLALGFAGGPRFPKGCPRRIPARKLTASWRIGLPSARMGLLPARGTAPPGWCRRRPDSGCLRFRRICQPGRGRWSRPALHRRAAARHPVIGLLPATARAANRCTAGRKRVALYGQSPNSRSAEVLTK